MIKARRCEGATLPETLKLHVQTVPADKEAETGLMAAVTLGGTKVEQRKSPVKGRHPL